MKVVNKKTYIAPAVSLIAIWQQALMVAASGNRSLMVKMSYEDDIDDGDGEVEEDETIYDLGW